MKPISIILFSIIALMLVSCAPTVVNKEPLGYSFMPNYVELDSIGPNIPVLDSVVDSTLSDFPAVPLEEGTLVTDEGDTIYTPAGILISDRDAVEFNYLRSTQESTRKQLYYSEYLRREHYEKTLDVQALYQEEIAELQEAAKRSWYEQNKGTLGFIGGILTCIFTGVVIVQIAD